MLRSISRYVFFFHPENLNGDESVTAFHLHKKTPTSGLPYILLHWPVASSCSRSVLGSCCFAFNRTPELWWGPRLFSILGLKQGIFYLSFAFFSTAWQL